MLFVFLFSQIAVAAAPQQSSPYTDPNTTPAANSQPPVFTDNSGQAVLGTADSLSNYYFNEFKNSWGWDWLKTTNFNFSAFSGNTPQWNINTFQPLTMKDNLNNFLFAQGQYGTNNNTVNVGLGYRSMDVNHNSMYGVNLFYDWQTTVQGEGTFSPTGSHMRVGAGLEYFTGSIETRLNGYYGISSDVQVGGLQTTGIEAGTTAWQHVAPGADLSIGTDFSFWNAPWLKLTATGNYYAQTQNGTINGYLGSAMNANLTAQLQVTPQIAVYGGGTIGNGGQSNANVGFQLNLLVPPQPALFLADPVTNNLAATDISYKMLQPVQRNNAITTERYLKTEVVGYTVSVLVTNTDGGLVPGATVSLAPLAQSAAIAASSSQTYSGISGSDGVAIIKNVASGAYTSTATCDGFALKTNTVEVKGADIANSMPPLPATVTYTVNVTVTENDGTTGIPNASVTFGGISKGTTDTNGRISFAVGKGNYSTVMTETGYQTLTASASINADPTALNYSMIQLHNVTLTVTDNASPANPVNNASVTLGTYNAVTTDSSGQCTINDVADASNLQIAITANGYSTPTGLTTTIVNGVANPSTFSLTPDATHNVTLTITDNSTPTKPVTGASVTLSTYSPVTTNSQGQCTINNVTDGSYTVTISASGYITPTGLNTNIVNGVAAPASFALTPKNVQTVDVKISVYNYSGGALIPDSIELQQNGVAVYTVSNPATATTVIPSVAYGTYILAVKKAGYLMIGNDAYNTLNIKGPSDYSTTYNRNASLSSNACTINLTVLHGDGSPWAGVETSLYSAITDNNGKVSGVVPPSKTNYVGIHAKDQSGNYITDNLTQYFEVQAGQVYNPVMRGCCVNITISKQDGTPMTGSIGIIEANPPNPNNRPGCTLVNGIGQVILTPEIAYDIIAQGGGGPFAGAFSLSVPNSASTNANYQTGKVSLNLSDYANNPVAGDILLTQKVPTDNTLLSYLYAKSNNGTYTFEQIGDCNWNLGDLTHHEFVGISKASSGQYVQQTIQAGGLEMGWKYVDRRTCEAWIEDGQGHRITVSSSAERDGLIYYQYPILTPGITYVLRYHNVDNSGHTVDQITQYQLINAGQFASVVMPYTP